MDSTVHDESLPFSCGTKSLNLCRSFESRSEVSPLPWRDVFHQSWTLRVCGNVEELCQGVVHVQLLYVSFFCLQRAGAHCPGQTPWALHMVLMRGCVYIYIYQLASASQGKMQVAWFGSISFCRRCPMPVFWGWSGSKQLPWNILRMPQTSSIWNEVNVLLAVLGYKFQAPAGPNARMNLTIWFQRMFAGHQKVPCDVPCRCLFTWCLLLSNMFAWKSICCIPKDAWHVIPKRHTPVRTPGWNPKSKGFGKTLHIPTLGIWWYLSQEPLRVQILINLLAWKLELWPTNHQDCRVHWWMCNNERILAAKIFALCSSELGQIYLNYLCVDNATIYFGNLWELLFFMPFWGVVPKRHRILVFCTPLLTETQGRELCWVVQMRTVLTRSAT